MKANINLSHPDIEMVNLPKEEPPKEETTEVVKIEEKAEKIEDLQAPEPMVEMPKEIQEINKIEEDPRQKLIEKLKSRKKSPPVMSVKEYF